MQADASSRVTREVPIPNGEARAVIAPAGEILPVVCASPCKDLRLPPDDVTRSGAIPVQGVTSCPAAHPPVYAAN